MVTRAKLRSLANGEDALRWISFVFALSTA